MQLLDPSTPPRRTLLILTAAALLVLLLLVPPEQTLGEVIRVIFLHGALVQVGLLAFAAAGILGAIALFRPEPAWLSASLAAQKTSVIVWIAYVLSSMLSTYLAWSIWIAWDEPRVRISFQVLWFSVACLLLVLWIGNRIFTGITNVVVSSVVWWLVKGATILRHPLDPIGASNSSSYRWIFLGILLLVFLLTAQVAQWLFVREQAKLVHTPVLEGGSHGTG
jgi:hypothetical protein